MDSMSSPRVPNQMSWRVPSSSETQRRSSARFTAYSQPATATTGEAHRQTRRRVARPTSSSVEASLSRSSRSGR